MLRHSLGAMAGAALVAVALSGCGSGGDDSRVEVSGTVTLDGTPVESGLIKLEPVDGKGPSAGDSIVNGKYTVQITPGEKKVIITAQKAAGGTPKGAGAHDAPAMKEIIPAQYNTKSTLTLKVGPGGQDDADFPLKSTP